MHVAWVGKKSPFCGNVVYSREVTKALVDRGHRVSFIHYDFDENDAIATANKDDGAAWPDLREVSIPCLYKSTYVILQSPKASKVLVEALQELKPDLVHVSGPVSFLDAQLPDICHSLGLPLVVTFHLPFDNNKRFNWASGTQMLWYQVCARTLAKCDRTIIFSQNQKDLLVRLGVTAERVAVIPNSVDALKYSPGPSNLKAELGAERVFVYQGRLAVEKNVESLLKAWKLAEMAPSSKLAIVGDGPLRSSLQSPGDSECGIVWMGYIGEDDRRIEILRGADVFILPSLVEGLSLSLLEAMSCGLACLATDVGADGEVLADGAGVVLDPAKIVAQLQTLLPLFQDHPELASMLGYKARQRILERYRSSENISRLEQLYAEVLPQKSQSLRSNLDPMSKANVSSTAMKSPSPQTPLPRERDFKG